MNDTVRLRKLALTALFVAVGILLAPFSIPLGAAKTFPFQHMLNVLIAVFLGWRYGVAGRPPSRIAKRKPTFNATG